MNVRLIQIPYDSGQRATRLGLGPLYFIDKGLPSYLQNRGHNVRVSTLESTLTMPMENATAFELAGSVAASVRAAREAGEFPLVLSGNCNSSLGTVAGLSPNTVGVIWFDAHGDFNTPETTRSGFLDGMALATLTGRCWQTVARSIEGFAPVAEENVVMVGARDLDREEQQLLEGTQVTMLRLETGQSGLMLESLRQAVEAMARRVGGVYVHVDLDVLDPSVGRANKFAVPGGLSLEDLLKSVEVIGRSARIFAAALTAYDPQEDTEGRVFEAGCAVAKRILELAG